MKSSGIFVNQIKIYDYHKTTTFGGGWTDFVKFCAFCLLATLSS
jgi:hypothetical protein